MEENLIYILTTEEGSSMPIQEQNWLRITQTRNTLSCYQRNTVCQVT